MKKKLGTRAHTTTQTTTVSRSYALGKIIKSVVLDTGATTSEHIDGIIEKGIIQNRWIEVIHIWGMDSNNDIVSEMLLRIDWERHEIHIQEGRNKIIYNESLKPVDNLSNQRLGTMVDIYLEIIKEKRLKTMLAITYINGIDMDLVYKTIGSSGITYKRKSGSISHLGSVNDKKLDELLIDMNCVVDDEDSDTNSSSAKQEDKRTSGSIKKYFDDKGYGFILIFDDSGKPTKETAFFHISNVIKTQGRIGEQEQVLFELETSSRGLRAVNITVL